MKKNNNRKLFKIMLIVIDIIVIAGLLIITCKWISDNVKKQEIAFKNFTFYIPNSIDYKEDYDFAFILETDDYLANVIVYSDKDNSIFTETDKYQYWLLAQGIMVDQYKKEKILDKDALIFTNYRGDSNSLLCYFRTEDIYLVEVRITAKSDKFNANEVLSQIVDIFDSAKYNASGKYSYLIHNFTVDDQEYFEDLKEVSK